MPASLQLTSTQNCDVEVSGAVDKKGNPAELDGPVAFSSSDTSLVTVTPDPTDPNKATMSAVGPVTPSGTNVVISIDGDGKIGPEVLAIHDEVAVTVVAGDAVGFAISVGTPTEQP